MVDGEGLEMSKRVVCFGEVLIRIVAGREQLFTRDLASGTEKQITFDDADHEDPAWSPDGRKIAYILIKGGKKIVHLMNPDGSGSQAITPRKTSSWPIGSCTGTGLLPCSSSHFTSGRIRESY